MTKIGHDSEGNLWSVFQKHNGLWSCSMSSDACESPRDVWYHDGFFATEEECIEWTKEVGMDGEYEVPWWADDNQKET